MDNTSQVSQLLQPQEYSVISSKRASYRPRSSHQNGFRNTHNSLLNSRVNKHDLTLNDEKTPEQTKQRLVLKHFGGTSHERIRHRRSSSGIEQPTGLIGFNAALKQNKEELRIRLNTPKDNRNINPRLDYSNYDPKLQPNDNTSISKAEQLRRGVSFDQNEVENDNPDRQRMRSTTAYPKYRSTHRLNSSTGMREKDSLQGFYSTAGGSEADPEGQNCFKVDYSFLDNISMDDPKLVKILNDDLLKSKQIDLEAIIEENADYFHHLFGNCACFKCTCGRCRCQQNRMKVIYRNGMSTSYHSQFPQKKQAGITPPLNQTFYESLANLKRHQPIIDPSHTTTHKKDYPAHDPQIKERKPDFQHVKVPFLATSHYKSNFIDWKEYDPTYVFKRPPHNSVVSEHPMRTKTTYNQLFRDDQDKIDNATASDVKQMQKNQTFPNTYTDDKPTEYTKKFKQSNPNDLPSSKLPFKYMTQTERFNPIPQWNTQFKSVNQKDFRQQNEPNCPTVYNNLTKPWKLKLVQKLRQLGYGTQTTSASASSSNSGVTPAGAAAAASSQLAGRSQTPQTDSVGLVGAGATATSSTSVRASKMKKIARSTVHPHQY